MHRAIRSIAAALAAAPLLFCLAGCGGTATLNASAAAGSSSGTGSGSGGSSASNQSVALSWAPSSSPVAGYMVFRGTASGGPYTALTGAPITATSYTDKTVQAHKTYYYVTAAVTSAGVQSAYSNQATAAIP